MPSPRCWPTSHLSVCRSTGHEDPVDRQIDGQLGFELERALAPLGEVIGSTLSGRSTGGGACEPMDLSDSGSIGACLQLLRPDLVVNPAAYTAVDRAESEPTLAHAINAGGVAALAQWCARNDVPLLHYSTDYVFSGEQQRPWREDDAPARLGVYGAYVKLTNLFKVEHLDGFEMAFANLAPSEIPGLIFPGASPENFGIMKPPCLEGAA